MSGAITRASADIRDAVEREVSRQQAAPAAHRAASVGADVLEIVLDDNRISQLQREWLERPENYLRPIRIREYWRPSGVEDGELVEVAARGAAPSARGVGCHGGANHETVSDRAGLRRHYYSR
jgi:hypothetical protein